MGRAKVNLIPCLVLGGLTALWLFGGFSPRDGYTSVSQTIKLYGILGGALLAVASPLFSKDSSFQPFAVLGWLAGVGVAIFVFETCRDLKLTGALLVPPLTVAGMSIGQSMDKRPLIDSPLMPLLVCYFILGLWVGQAPHTSYAFGWADLQILAVTVLLATLQLGMAAARNLRSTP